MVRGLGCQPGHAADHGRTRAKAGVLQCAVSMSDWLASCTRSQSQFTADIAGITYRDEPCKKQAYQGSQQHAKNSPCLLASTLCVCIRGATIPASHGRCMRACRGVGKAATGTPTAHACMWSWPLPQHTCLAQHSCPLLRYLLAYGMTSTKLWP